MSFTLARASTVMLPATIVGARIYISVGSPMFLAVNAEDDARSGRWPGAIGSSPRTSPRGSDRAAPTVAT
jgi:hypothetical protein